MRRASRNLDPNRTRMAERRATQCNRSRGQFPSDNRPTRKGRAKLQLCRGAARPASALLVAAEPTASNSEIAEDRWPCTGVGARGKGCYPIVVARPPFG